MQRHVMSLGRPQGPPLAAPLARGGNQCVARWGSCAQQDSWCKRAGMRQPPPCQGERRGGCLAVTATWRRAAQRLPN